MKINKSLLIVALAFFTITNTSYYWDGYLGAWAMLSFGILALVFIILSISLLKQISHALKERASNRPRFILIAVITLVLGSTVLAPAGIIDFEKFEGKDLLIAEREGVAGCTMRLKIKEHNQFYLREVCFGVDKYSGSWSINKDTIQFHSRIRGFYEYAIVRASKSSKAYYEIGLYKTTKDTAPLFLSILKNELMKP